MITGEPTAPVMRRDELESWLGPALEGLAETQIGDLLASHNQWLALHPRAGLGYVVGDCSHPRCAHHAELLNAIAPGLSGG